MIELCKTRTMSCEQEQEAKSLVSQSLSLLNALWAVNYIMQASIILDACIHDADVKDPCFQSARDATAPKNCQI